MMFLCLLAVSGTVTNSVQLQGSQAQPLQVAEESFSGEMKKFYNKKSK